MRISLANVIPEIPDEKFLQIHRMCVVNQDYIDYMDIVNGLISMKNGSRLEIGVSLIPAPAV